MMIVMTLATRVSPARFVTARRAMKYDMHSRKLEPAACHEVVELSFTIVTDRLPQRQEHDAEIGEVPRKDRARSTRGKQDEQGDQADDAIGGKAAVSQNRRDVGRQGDADQEGGRQPVEALLRRLASGLRRRRRDHRIQV